MSLILVVDDSESVRAMVRVALETGDHRVVQAATGLEAIQLLATPRGPTPALVILNLEMPLMSGWEFVRIVKGHRRLASIPLLIISAHDPTVLRKCGIAGYLRKPFSRAELLSCVANHACKGIVFSGA
jgi:CheY-like chemotaxis protein